jgi:uncharacterized membrane protein
MFSDAAVSGVGPFELDGVDAEGARLPGTDVADFDAVVWKDKKGGTCTTTKSKGVSLTV